MNLYLPKKIVIGFESALRIAGELASMGLEKGRLLVVLDPGIKNMGHVEQIMKSLSSHGYSYEIYTDVEYEPSIECAERLAEQARKGVYDAVIGIGGGSALDLAKVGAISRDNPGRNVQDFVGAERVGRRITPLILLPSTAGTGSEVTRYAVLSKGSSKLGIASIHTVPDIALVDPMLTLTMPPRVTAGTGLDALSHAVEAMISTDANPLTDSLALTAIHYIFRYLRRAYLRGSDLEARFYMSMAATTAGIPLSSARVVLGHSISQTFGPRYRIHHGTACGMTLPYIMDFYLPAAHEKLALMARAAGVSRGLSTVEDAKIFIEAVWELLRDLEIPLSLREIGVSEAELEGLAEQTLRDWPRPNSPVELTKERVLGVYRNMYYGRLSRLRI